MEIVLSGSHKANQLQDHILGGVVFTRRRKRKDELLLTVNPTSLASAVSRASRHIGILRCSLRLDTMYHRISSRVTRGGLSVQYCTDSDFIQSACAGVL